MTATTNVIGLGFGPDPTMQDPTTTTTPPPTTGGTNWASWVDKAFSWLNSASDLYQSTQNQPGGNGQPPVPPPTNNGMSTTTKVAIGVGVAAVLAGGIYALTRKKKK